LINVINGSVRGLRGGSWYNFSGLDSYYLQSSFRDYFIYPTGENIGIGFSIGFRVATVPEPSTLLLLVVGAVGSFGLRRRLGA
jgi:hypothetical protein